MAELSCPPLGTGSVDLNALHDAAKKNKPIDDALLAKATTRVEAPADAPSDPASAPAADA